MAIQDYRSHEILEQDPGKSILLQRPGCSNYWAEILFGRAGSLIITGDGPDIVLRRWSNYSHETMISWCATSGLDYLASKVMTRNGRIWSFDYAVGELEGYARDYEGESLGKSALKMLERIEKGYVGEEESEFHEEWHDVCRNWYEGRLGARPSMELIRAREICRRARTLLLGDLKETETCQQD